jgi:hypothetical protein
MSGISQEKKLSQVQSSDAKRHPGGNLEKKLFVGSIVLFIISFMVLLTAVYITGERNRVPFAGAEPGKPISSGISTTTVTNIQRSNGKKPFAAPSGYEYIILTLRVRNNSEEPFDALPTTDTYIKTNEGHVSYVTPYSLVRPFHSGQILPGESTAGELSYLVPKNSAYKFYVESDWTGGVVSFMIQSDKHKRDTN